MASWNELNAGVRPLATSFDIVRWKYLRQPVDRKTVLLSSGRRPWSAGSTRRKIEQGFHHAGLSVHKAAPLTFMHAPAYRLIENLGGLSFIQADAPKV